MALMGPLSEPNPPAPSLDELERQVVHVFVDIVRVIGSVRCGKSASRANAGHTMSRRSN
jgi:hypothetical protein